MVPVRDAHVDVQAHAADAREALDFQDLEVVDVDAAAEAPDALARPVAVAMRTPNEAG